jgi:hypothetical protein
VGAGGRAVRVDPPREPFGRFGPERMPQHQGGGPTIAPDPDCCSDEHCPQRDYNRAVILATMRLSQAYAAVLLLEWTTRQLWHCADGVHTDCGTPECTFGSEQADAVAFDGELLAAAVECLYKTLSRPATDLTAQWQELSDAELARSGIDAVHPTGDAFATDFYLDALRGIIVGDDDDEFARWFEPPPPTDQGR